MHTHATTEHATTCPTPQPAGSGADEATSQDTSTPATPPPPTPHLLTAALTRDLLDPTVSILDLCDYHDLSLNQLQDIIKSEIFRRLKDAFEEVSDARTELIELDARPRARASLLAVTRRPFETDQGAESARKAATTLERITRPSTPAPAPAGKVVRHKRNKGDLQQTACTSPAPAGEVVRGEVVRHRRSGDGAQKTAPIPTNTPQPPIPKATSPLRTFLYPHQIMYSEHVPHPFADLAYAQSYQVIQWGYETEPSSAP